MNNRSAVQLKKLTAAAMLCAVAYVLTYVKFPVLFLSLEIKDAVIVLCTLLFGPLYGLSIAVIVPLLELVTHSDTGVYGLIMNMLSSLTFSLVTGLIYKYKRSFYGAIVSLVSGVCAVTAVMMGANLLVTPYYMGVSTEAVVALIPKVLLPFNLVKATLNGAIVLLLYKPLSQILKRLGFLPRRSEEEQGSKPHNAMRSVLVTAIAVVCIGLSLAIVFLVLNK